MGGCLQDKEIPSPRVLACCSSMVSVFGLERMTFEVLRVLSERGAAVHCIVNSWENHRIVALAEQVGASWSTGPYHIHFNRHTRNPIKLIRFALNILRMSLGLLKNAWRFRPTHIFIPEFMIVLRSAPALALLRLFDVSVILRLGNPPGANKFYYRLWRWGIDPFIDFFVCNSRFTEQELLAHGISSQKVICIYNTVPLRTAENLNANIARDFKKVLYVGQIIPEKGLDILLDAIGLLVKRGLDVRLDVVGQIEGWEAPSYAGYRARLLARASRPDLLERVRFLGLREDVPALLAGAGIHCCPSRPEQREGFGVVNLEAKQAGTPSVVFPTGALPELITHAKDGWICSDFSADSLAEGIEFFLEDPARLKQAGCAARSSVSRFNREQFADAWWKIFQPATSSQDGL